jgi:hypothetical protein
MCINRLIEHGPSIESTKDFNAWFWNVQNSWTFKYEETRSNYVPVPYVHYTKWLKKKVKLSLCLLIKHYAMKTYRGVDEYCRFTFSWPRHKLEVSGQLHAPAALLPGKSSRYPFYRRLGGPQSRSGRYGEVKLFNLRGLELPPPPNRLARSQSLYRLSYPGFTKWLKLFQNVSSHVLAQKLLKEFLYTSRSQESAL